MGRKNTPKQIPQQPKPKGGGNAGSGSGKK